MSNAIENQQQFDPVQGDVGEEAPNTNLLVFELDRHAYALPVPLVEQIVEMVTITPLPQETPRVEGLINVRGMMVPVVDLGSVLGLGPVELGLDTPLVLVRVIGRTVGLIVDRVLEVLSLPADQILLPRSFLPADLSGVPLIEGVVRGSRGPILILDLDHLFAFEGGGLTELRAYFAMLDESTRCDIGGPNSG